MKTFPIMLNLAGRIAVVVGGGNVGLHKAKMLLAAGAKVRLISSRPPEDPKQIASPSLELVISDYEPHLLQGAFLVVACTNDEQLNHRIAEDARKAGAMVNVADQPEDCDFLLPAVTRVGEVVVAVGTGGSSPALAASLRDRLSAALPEQIGPFAETLAAIRQELRGQLAPRQRGDIMKQLSNDDSYRAFAAGGEKALRQRLAELLE